MPVYCRGGDMHRGCTEDALKAGFKRNPWGGHMVDRPANSRLQRRSPPDFDIKAGQIPPVAAPWLSAQQKSNLRESFGKCSEVQRFLNRQRGCGRSRNAGRGVFCPSDKFGTTTAAARCGRRTAGIQGPPGHPALAGRCA